MSLLFNMLSRLGHSFPSKEQTSFSFMAAVTIWSDSGAGALELVIAGMWGSFCNELRKSKPISSKIQIKNKAYAWKNPASYMNFYGQEYLLEFRGKWFISVLPSCFWEFLWKKKSLCFPTVPFRVNSSSVIKAGKTRLETIAFRTSITSLLKNFYINESKTCLCM